MKILIVDDEAEILKMLRRLLELEGFEVTICQDPKESLELMRRELFNIVLSDIRMPSMLGTDLIDEMKKIHPLVNMVIMTGYSNMDYVVDCIGRGAVDYFTKPFTQVDQLITALNQIRAKLERWHTAMKN